MAYVTGTATSLAGLISTVKNACTSNGWTLSGDVLHKGTCYAEVVASGTYLKLHSGTGVDGANALTGRSTNPAAYMANPILFGSLVNFSWPAVYDIFINVNPDEVYVHVTFNVNCHEQVGWGISTMQGLVGSGNWYAGGNAYAIGYGYSGTGYNYGPPGAETILNGYSQSIALFASDLNKSCGVHHSLDGPSWDAGYGIRDSAAILGRQPNQWNGESILAPVRCYAGRPSGYISPVLECAHLRYVSIASLVDGQVITLGPDKWMVFPYARRGGTNASVPATGSQFAGHAFRYDGP